MKKQTTNLLITSLSLFKQTSKSHFRRPLFIIPHRPFSNPYSDRLRQLRQSIKQTTDEAIQEQEQKKATQSTNANPTEEQFRSYGLFSEDQTSKSDPYRADIIYSFDLDQLLSTFSRAVQDQYLKPSYDFFNACLDRLNQIICERDANLSKDQIVQILTTISYYRPKEEADKFKKRKEAGLVDESEVDQFRLSMRHRELIQDNKKKFQTVPEHMFDFVKTNLSKGLLRDLFTHKDEKQQSKVKVSLFDVVGQYIELYENLSVRVLDMSNQGLIDSKDALDILVSYSIAEEGTNMLYIRMIETLLKRKEDYNIVEIEMLLNYFPHQIWRDDERLIMLRDAFYSPIINKIEENVSKLQKRQFLSVFQGLTLAGEKVFTPLLLNQFLNQYAQRIKKTQEQEESEKFTLKEVMIFLELYIQFLRQTSELQDRVDSQTLIDFTNDQIVIPCEKELSFNQISGLYWTYHNLKIQWREKVVQILEERMAQMLREEILIQKQLDKSIKGDEKEGLQTLNLYDLEVIEHYYEVNQSLGEVSKRKKEILKLIQQAKHLDKPEKERKWFHF